MNDMLWDLIRDLDCAIKGKICFEDLIKIRPEIEKLITSLKNKDGEGDNEDTELDRNLVLDSNDIDIDYSNFELNRMGGSDDVGFEDVLYENRGKMIHLRSNNNGERNVSACGRASSYYHPLGEGILTDDVRSVTCGSCHLSKQYKKQAF